MTWQLVKFDAESDDRSVRGFVWVLVIGTAVWGVAFLAIVLRGVTR